MSSRTRIQVLPLLASLIVIGANADTVTLDYTSPRIQWQGSWSNGDHFRASLSRSQTFAVFWSGTGIHVQGRVQGDSSVISFSVDNDTSKNIPIPEADGKIFVIEGLESGDHQLLMSRLPVLSTNTSLYLHNITLEREELGTPLFDPSNLGTTATEVPSDAALIDDTWPGLHKTGNWTCWEDPRLPINVPEYWYNNTATETVNEGDSLYFTFHGSSIWIYGTRYSSGGVSDVYVDGKQMGTIDSHGYKVQDLLWSIENLTDSKHDIQITTRKCCTACGEACLSVDFFRILNDFPGTPDTDGEDGGHHDGFDGSDTPAIIAGVVGGAFFVLLTSLGTFAWKRLFALS